MNAASLTELTLPLAALPDVGLAWLAAGPLGLLGAAEPSWFQRLTAWLVGSLGLAGRIGLIAVLVAVVLYLLVRWIRRMSTRGRRAVLIGMTLLGLLGTLSFGVVAWLLPEQQGRAFVWWHQAVRGGAALSVICFTIGALGLAIPRLLDLIERSGFKGYIAARHVRSGKSGFLTVISILSISGVAVSTFALCAVISIMGGFGQDLKRKILGNNAHIHIAATEIGGFGGWRESIDAARRVPGVHAASPIAAGEAMASSHSNTGGVMLKGVDTESIGQVIDLIDNIEAGRFEYLVDPSKLTRLAPDEIIGYGPGGRPYYKGPIADWQRKVAVGDDSAPEVYPGIIIGRELSKTLNALVGDEITLVGPLGELGPMGVMPRTRKFRVAGIFYSGMYEYDSSFAYVDIGVAQRFLDLGEQVTSIEVKLSREEDVGVVGPAIVKALSRDDVRVRDWKELNRSLFSALELEKIVTFVILFLACIVASFCIVCTLLLMVTEKSKEIAILKAVGTSDRVILAIFMSEGMIIGAIGTVFGVVTGAMACIALKVSGARLDPDVYYVDRLPISINVTDYLLIALCAMLVTTLATIYPASAASRLRPVDGIRYE
ncbi:MAG: ABC transporter permease [Polyangiaceae bacterium]|nr:ABC transporter permease [Polyangiaceae bacterium]MCW5790487.1 ABC transporter permease [Polyangiaceae bacterium]